MHRVAIVVALACLLGLTAACTPGGGGSTPATGSSAAPPSQGAPQSPAAPIGY
ncbi:MAG TPA: hypothetical protein VFO05_00570 [Candidatus Limnocylindrales bacterium]|nr:hypothetical protein [Candidatus Limnocylindrales bacterium]